MSYASFDNSDVRYRRYFLRCFPGLGLWIRDETCDPTAICEEPDSVGRRIGWVHRLRECCI